MAKNLGCNRLHQKCNFLLCTTTTTNVLGSFYKGSSAFAREAGNGWELATVLTLQSGTPFTVVTNDTAFVQARADYVPGCNPTRSGSVESRITEYFNTACFVPVGATVGDFGDVPRNSLRGPDQKNVDISIVKFFPITEKTKVEFRSEFFNAFNMVSFANPVYPTTNVANLTSPYFGQILSTSTGPRVIQFALKVNFQEEMPFSGLTPVHSHLRLNPSGGTLSSTRQDHNVLRVTREARGRISGDGVELAFGYWPGRGAPVVALHGLTANYLNFIGVAECLHCRLPLLGFDLRGRGDSDKPNGPYGLAQHGRDVAAAMRAMGLGASIIVGHSMGAFVATALAEQNPELVSGLVLIDGGYVPAMPVGGAAGGQNAALLERISQLNRTYPSRKNYREFWRGQPHFPSTDWNRWVEAFLDYEVGGESPVQPKASSAAVIADMAEVLQRDAIVARLRSIRVPTILVRAVSGFTPDQPPLFPDNVVAEIRDCVPHIEDHKIPGATHYTLALGETAAAKIAEIICALAQRIASKG